MIDEDYKDQADALIAGLRTNPKPGSDAETEQAGEKGRKKKPRSGGKKKRRWLFVLPIALVLLGGGVLFGLVKAGKIKSPLIAKLMPPAKSPAEQMKSEAPAPPATPDSAEAASSQSAESPDPVQSTPPPPKKKADEATLDPKKGAKKLASVWNEMEPDSIGKLAKVYGDDQLALVFSAMDADKVGAVLALMDPKRAAKVSEKIQSLASVVPTSG